MAPDILPVVPVELDVIGLGENSVDRVLVVPELPGTSLKMRVENATRSCGGQVATTMAACASLGLQPAYIGAVGNDDDGRLVRETLAANGVDVTRLRVRAIATTRWATILVDATSGERAVLWNKDAALTLTPAEVDAIDVTRARLVHVDDTDIAASLRLARAARATGRLVTTDIDAGAEQDEALSLATLATHVIVSEHALITLTGEADAERGLRALRAHCDGILCVTLGARGAMALDGDRALFSPGFSVTAIDTTGAGDVFRAGFICALLEQQPLPDILRFANAAAAVSCTRLGAITGIPMRRDVNAQLHQ